MNRGIHVRLSLFILFILAGPAGYAQPALQYISGDSTAQARVFAADSSGDIFTVFNVTEPSGRPQIRVMKTSAQGTALGSLDFGGSSGDTPAGAVTDPQGNLVVVGSTVSTDFPTVSPLVAVTDANVGFVVKLNAQLTQILFATRLGGSSGANTGGATSANAVATDANGNIYVTGGTRATDYPTTSGAFQTTIASGVSSGAPGYGFITELTPSGSAIVYSTLYGGSGTACTGGSACLGASGQTTANAITIDPSGAVVIAGNTTASNLPITAGTPGQSCGCPSGVGVPPEQQSGFIARFISGGSQLSWATYVNASVGSYFGTFSVRALALDATGDVVIAGSAPSGYATTAGAIQPIDPGGTNLPGISAGFVTKYSSTGQEIVFSTYMGGGPVASLAVDSTGGVWATGTSVPTYLPLPGSPPLLGTNYVVDLSSDGTRMIEGFTFPAGAAGLDIIALPQARFAALGSAGSIVTVTPGQQVVVAGLVNSGGFQVSGQVAPYELISLYGYGIGTSPALSGQVSNGVLGTSLGGVEVTFDGVPAPLLYAGPNQINAIVPGEIARHATTQLQVRQNNLIIQTLQLFVVASQPQIFATAATPQTLINMAIALNQDGSLNSATNPALPGSIMTVWATGAGGYAIPMTDGAINSSLTQPSTPIAILGGDSLDVLYGGDAPELVRGVIQVNFQLPSQFSAAQTSSGYVEIQMQTGDFASGACGVYIK